MSNIVVADAGPLHYLVLIDCGEILGNLFDHVLVPFAVRDELLHPRAPQKVKDWIIRPRPWLEITPVTQAQPVRGLHRGETEALQLALELSSGRCPDGRPGRPRGCQCLSDPFGHCEC